MGTAPGLLRVAFEDAIDGQDASLDRSAEIVGVLRELFPAPDSQTRGRLDDLWQHSLKVGVAAKRLAENCDGVALHEAFVAGLVHDIGKAVLILQFPKAAGRVARAARNRSECALLVEERIFGASHAAVGRCLLARWLLPEKLQHTAWLHHHALEDIPSDISDRALIALVDEANRRVHSASAHSFFKQEPAAEHHFGPPSDEDALSFEREVQEIERRIHRPLRLHTFNRCVFEQPPPANVAESEKEKTLAFDDAVQRIATLVADAPNLDRACAESASILADLLGLSRLVVFARIESRLYRACLFGGSHCHFQTVIVQDDRSTQRFRQPVLADRFNRFLGPGSVGCLPLVQQEDMFVGALHSVGGIHPASDAAPAHTIKPLLRMLGAAFESVLLRRGIESQADAWVRKNHLIKATKDRTVRSESLERVANLAAGAAHEINNPLAIIAGRAQMLRADAQDERDHSNLDLIIAQARRAGDIVSQLMDYAKPPAPRPVSVGLLDWAKRLRQHWHRESGLALEQIQIDIDCPELTVFVDERQLWNACGAIIANAIDALSLDEHGANEFANIQINSPSTRTDDTIVMAIRDNGRGMSPDVREHALDPFFSHRAAGRGRGLGLSLAARTIEINGGRLWIESAEGEGTVVYLSLPSGSK